MKKKIFTFLFAIVASMTSLNAEIIASVHIGELFYNLSTESGTAEVTSHYSDAYSGNITIPSSVEYESTSYQVTRIGEKAFEWCKDLSSVTIPSSVISIGNDAFLCSGLQSIIIANSVTKIGKSAFEFCNKLVSITLPNNLEVLEERMFSSCSNLTSVTIPNGVTSIGDDAFQWCENMSSITIPNSVISIGNDAFSSSGLQSITIPNSVISIGESAFEECASLTSATLPNSVTSIGGAAFAGCVQLTSVVLPSNITVIEGGMFSGCAKLVSVTIPNSVTRVEAFAFYACPSLAEIRNYGETPANAYSTTFFDGVNLSTCKLYVPKNSINLYKNAPVWKEFYLISAIEDVQAIEDAEADNARSAKVIIDGKVYINRGDKTYTLQGQEVK